MNTIAIPFNSVNMLNKERNAMNAFDRRAHSTAHIIYRAQNVD